MLFFFLWFASAALSAYMFIAAGVPALGVSTMACKHFAMPERMEECEQHTESDWGGPHGLAIGETMQLAETRSPTGTRATTTARAWSVQPGVAQIEIRLEDGSSLKQARS